MGKSEGRHAVHATWPNAFAKNAYPSTLDEATVVADDVMQRLKAVSVFKDPKAHTWASLSETMLAEPIKFLKECPNIKVSVQCFDIYPYVPLAKACEQQVRSSRAAVGDGELISDENFSTGPPNAEVPHHMWSQAVNHRTKYTPKVIAYLVHCWASSGIIAASIPPGTSIIVSGHYIETPVVGVNGEFQIEMDGTTDIFDTPLEFKSDGSIVARVDLANRLGEGDYAIPYLVSKLMEKEMNHVVFSGDEDKVTKPTCVILSTDSDFLSILLMATFKLQYRLRFIWRMWPGLANIANGPWKTVKGLDDQLWCDISTLYACIAEDPGLAAFRSPVFAVIAALTAACGDYTDSIPRVPPAHWLKTIRNNATYIGDIFSEFMAFSPAAYVRLQEAACRQAAVGPKKVFVGVPGETLGAHVPMPKTMPDANASMNRANHLWYALLQILKVLEPSVHVEGLHAFSYARVRIDEPVSRTNIARVHEGLVRDYFEDPEPRRAVEVVAEDIVVDEDEDTVPADEGGRFVPPLYA